MLAIKEGLGAKQKQEPVRLACRNVESPQRPRKDGGSMMVVQQGLSAGPKMRDPNGALREGGRGSLLCLLAGFSTVYGRNDLVGGGNGA